MQVCVIGGKLQGMEATYLAHKAGWEVLLVDKNPSPPAKGLCDRFYQVDVTDANEFLPFCRDAQLLIPALENQKALDALQHLAQKHALPLAYDPLAYGISSSKLKSDRLFMDLALPVPHPWPKGKFPLIVKPSGSSGSEGIRRMGSPEELESFRLSQGTLDGWIAQEFLEGPSFSLEVLGFPEEHQTLQVTDLEMDASYDCKRVLAPTALGEGEIKQFEEITLTISKALNLRGIMDVEVILHDGQLKLLEIDARLPSQTPTAVYLSTGINMVELLSGLFSGHSKPKFSSPSSPRGVVYEHLKASPGRLEVSGEHIMANSGPLQLWENFFGADEAITNYEPHRAEWVATLFVTAESRKKAWKKRCGVIEQIRTSCSLLTYLDPSPANSPSLQKS
jgi:pyrrolysine biosynthesis protein PylC